MIYHSGYSLDDLSQKLIAYVNDNPTVAAGYVLFSSFTLHSFNPTFFDMFNTPFCC